MNVRISIVRLILAALPAVGSYAQIASSLPSQAAELAEQCSGPLGGLIPQCQAVRGDLTSPGLPKHAPPMKNIPDTVQSTTPKSAAGPAPLPEPPPPATPEGPTEFQRFAASSVGRVLPIFGASLFN